MADLKPKQIEAAALLASGETVTSAAVKVGVARETVHEWLKDNRFTAHVNTLKHEIIDAVVAQIQSASTLALATINDLMTSSKNDSIRLAAAIKILEATHAFDRAQRIGSTNVVSLDFADYEDRKVYEHKLKVLSQNSQ